MHRHRRCVQIMQDFTTLHGYETPEELKAAGIKPAYDAAMLRAQAVVRQLEKGSSAAASSLLNT